MYRKRLKGQDLAIGVIRIHERGFGFLIPDEREKFPEDVFIPRHATKGAVDGDHVEVAISSFSRSQKGPEGCVKKILQRGRSHLAGVISYIGRKSEIYAYVPLLKDDMALHIVPPKDRMLVVGDRVIIRILDWGGKQRALLGEVSAYIGHISDPTCDITGAIEEFGLAADFSKETLDEANSYGHHVSKKELKNRKDLRDQICFTIDPDTAKDYDDALSLTIDREGEFHLGVHIADVSHYVKNGSALDIEAAQRCNSIYLPGMVLPMLPHELSSHLCSLKENLCRLTISVLMRLDRNGDLKEYEIVRTMIKSKKRFTYKEAKEILDGKKKSKYAPSLKAMASLCSLLKKKRAARGSIEFALPDVFIELTEEKTVKKFHFIEYDITHQLVEEFMLLANEVVASHLSQRGLPITYRVHEEPNPESIREFAQAASLLGYPISNQPSIEELQQLFHQVENTPLATFLATAFIKSMKLAIYSVDNIGHYGLGLHFYTHFTSPIRRYIDLLVHRALFGEIKNSQDLQEIAIRCSEKERLSAKAESSVLLLKKLRYLESQLMINQTIYEAFIIAIKNFGILFEIKEMMYESFLPLQSKGLTVGQKIQIQLKSVDLVTRRTEWDLVRSPSKKKVIRRKK